jgi:hypothetical protein
MGRSWHEAGNWTLGFAALVGQDRWARLKSFGGPGGPALPLFYFALIFFLSL